MNITGYDKLGKKNVMLILAFLTSIVHLIKCKYDRFLKYPLSTSIISLFIICIYLTIMKIIISFCPEFLKSMVSIIMIASIIYYSCFKVECKPFIVYKYNSPNKKINFSF